MRSFFYFVQVERFIHRCFSIALTLTLLCSLLSASDLEEDWHTIEKPIKPSQEEVFNYTQKHHQKENVNNTLIFTQDTIEELIEDLDNIDYRAKDDHTRLIVLFKSAKKESKIEEKEDHTASTTHGTNAKEKQYCKKYILDNSGQLNKKSHRLAHQLGCHIVQTHAGSIIVGLTEWFVKAKAVAIVHLVTNAPIYAKEKILLDLLGYKKKMKVSNKSATLPWPLPPLAMVYLNRIVEQKGKTLTINAMVFQDFLGLSQKGFQIIKKEHTHLKSKLVEVKQNFKTKSLHLIKTKEIVKTQSKKITALTASLTALKKFVNCYFPYEEDFAWRIKYDEDRFQIMHLPDTSAEVLGKNLIYIRNISCFLRNLRNAFPHIKNKNHLQEAHTIAKGFTNLTLEEDDDELHESYKTFKRRLHLFVSIDYTPYQKHIKYFHDFDQEELKEKREVLLEELANHYDFTLPFSLL